MWSSNLKKSQCGVGETDLKMVTGNKYLSESSIILGVNESVLGSSPDIRQQPDSIIDLSLQYHEI